ncbi:DUF1330 domain-containing protein [Lichenihabitans sp. Uapishka_5]|uniref:DUF1330 domain-containing protein n=1 Tax=Lichenihabitans sp. Uapishka_5 TaxID=3037302 RepID=UPI0029E7DE88|nr:DUF1330 domain-containing protein [Lichenihabitans sp. Uapishka_5]MDX7950183.1 DUF1330 domain-containing protein [Lichenihabitans sp. Uapishka_5]
MPKAYLVVQYRAISDPDKLAAYSKLAGPAITAAGGRFLVRGMAIEAYEGGQLQRTVVVEFPDLATAKALYADPAYQKAIAALDGAAERDMRIVEGLD